MLNKNFYPTPKEVIKKMLSPFYRKIMDGGLTILEPSCGKGDIIKELLTMKSWGGKYTNKIYGFEIEPELSLICSTLENTQILGQDFLQYKGSMFFDLIVMNPPFDKGAEHLLHAWNILQQGDLVCLLNKETLQNLHTAAREDLAEIIKVNNGIVTELGKAFRFAERTTQAEIIMVHLTKKMEASPFDFDKIGFTPAGESHRFNFTETIDTKAIATRNTVKNIVLCYEHTTAAMAGFVKAIQEVSYYSKSIGFTAQRLLSVALSSIEAQKDKNDINPYALYNSMVETATSFAWSKVMSDVDSLSSRMTSEFRKKMDAFINNQKNAAFSEENIYLMFQYIMEYQGQIMSNGCRAIFDKLTQFSPKNLREGWKTNSHYKLNKTFIMPDCGRWDSRFDSMDFYRGDFVSWANDLDIVLCTLSGKNPEEMYLPITDNWNKVSTRIYDCAYAHTRKHGAKFNTIEAESEFFRIKLFKKGTIHLTFKNDELWAKFNQVACEGRPYLAEDLDRKHKADKANREQREKERNGFTK